MSAVSGRRRPRPERIRRICIVVNELGEVGEEIDLQFERLSRWLWRDDVLTTLLAVALRRFSFAATEREVESVFPLFGKALRVDVGIPNHQRVDERVRHSATGYGYVLKPFVAKISLADEDAVTILCEWSAGG